MGLSFFREVKWASWIPWEIELQAWEVMGGKWLAWGGWIPWEIEPRAWEVTGGKGLAWGGWIPWELELQAWEVMETKTALFGSPSNRNQIVARSCQAARLAYAMSPSFKIGCL